MAAGARTCLSSGNKRNKKRDERKRERERVSREQNFGVHHDSGRVPGYKVRDGGRRGSLRINTIRLSISLSLAPSSTSIFLALAANAT